MNEHKAICPGCKTDVVFENLVGGLRRCPACGFQYSLSGAPPPIGSPAWSGVEETFRILFKAFLIMLALAVVAIGVIFAGCALMFGR